MSRQPVELLPRLPVVPRLWQDSIAKHRTAVRDAILDAVGVLVVERGVASVTMSELAARADIGRATLYHYFPDLESALRAWHERITASHLDVLQQVRLATDEPGARLRNVLLELARMSHRREGSDAAAALHRTPEALGAADRLIALVEDVVRDAVVAGIVRNDVPPRELATFCVGALETASKFATRAAAARLVQVVLDGLSATR